MCELKCKDCRNFVIKKTHPLFEKELVQYGTCSIGIWENDSGEAGTWTHNDCNFGLDNVKEEWRK